VTRNSSSSMYSMLPIEVLQMILDYVDQADLATVCRVNKICCACAQDILYRSISIRSKHALKVIQTLSRSTRLSRRVRSFSATYIYKANPRKAIIKALQKMSSLRSLTLQIPSDLHYSILDIVYTFKLDSFTFESRTGELYSLLKFLHSQPSLTRLDLMTYGFDNIKVEPTCLPNLTWVSAPFPWLQSLIPNRPVSEVSIVARDVEHEDLNFFALSAAPIQKLTVSIGSLYTKPVKYLTSNFPSLVHLCISICIATDEEVRVSFFFLFLSLDIEKVSHSKKLNGSET
jgi:hypothetical protein